MTSIKPAMMDHLTMYPVCEPSAMETCGAKGWTHAGVPPGPGDAVVVADPAVGEVIWVDVALAGVERHCFLEVVTLEMSQWPLRDGY